MRLKTAAPVFLVALTMVVVIDAADAQLLGRRILRRDAEAMEEYYDDLEDYYEDRNPRLAREAERMEKYYEAVRKGRAVGPPPIVTLPGVRMLVDPRVRGVEHTAPQPQQPAPQPRSRWQSWGQTPEPTPAAPSEPTPAPPQPNSASVLQPTQAAQPSEVRRTSFDQEYVEESGLRFPPATDQAPAEGLGGAHAALQRSLERMAKDSPAAAQQWSKYLALPTSAVQDMPTNEYYTTAQGREQLAETLTRYDQVAGNPQYRKIATLPAFAQTRSELRQQLASLEQEPTLAEPELAEPASEELPTPPAN